MSIGKLWLTVFDDTGAQWPPSLHGSKVVLTESDTLLGCGHAGPYRTSPVFPLNDHFIIPSLEGEIVHFWFLCFDPAFSAMGRICANADEDVLTRTLFSAGLASVVLIGNQAELYERLVNTVGYSPRSREHWVVTNSEITDVRCDCPRAQSVSLPTLQPYSSLPVVAKTAMDEFISGMELLVPKIATHLPNELPVFLALVGAVDELAKEMTYVSSPHGAPPETLAEYDGGDFADRSDRAHQILFQNTDRVIQINAALSYLSTQALSGAVPILERRSLIRRHSLLGVGTAVLALMRMTRAIERAFASANLEAIITGKAADAGPLPGLDRLPEYESTGWQHSSVNRWKEKVTARPAYPKLPYFSGRLGFRETEYTISAALQSLTAGSHPEWSVLTLTHEMVHGHVRSLMAYLFQGNANAKPEKNWEDFYSRFRARTKNTPPTDECLIDSIRAIILSYCCVSISHGSLTREPANNVVYSEPQTNIDINVPGASQLRAMFERENRNISEVLVHVLDLHYFYRSRLAVYIPLIWRSWAALPQVRDGIRQYVLRSLLVTASKMRGTHHERFLLARTRLREWLTPLQGAEGGSAASTARKALELLTQDEPRERLFFPFAASLILVDLVDHVLTSETIRAALAAGDEFIELVPDDSGGEDRLDYTIPDGFVEAEIKSPSTYLAHRLSRNSPDSHDNALEAETIRLFLACCSRVHTEG